MAAETETDEEDGAPELAISLEKVCFIILKAREFDEADDFADPDVEATEEGELVYPDEDARDPAQEEIVSLVSSLSMDEQVDLVALMWLGRDDYDATDWEQVRADAAAAHNRRTAEYLCGNPLLSDHLTEGLAVLGLSCDAFDEAHV